MRGIGSRTIGATLLVALAVSTAPSASADDGDVVARLLTTLTDDLWVPIMLVIVGAFVVTARQIVRGHRRAQAPQSIAVLPPTPEPPPSPVDPPADPNDPEARIRELERNAGGARELGTGPVDSGS